MSEPTPAQRLNVSPRTSWVLWTSLQFGVVLMMGLMVGLHESGLGRPTKPVAGAWLGYVFAAIAVSLVGAGTSVYVRFVVREPTERNRGARLAREKLLAVDTTSDPDAKSLEIASILAGELRGAQILSWALQESGALLAAMTINFSGSFPPVVGVVVVWWLAMLFAAPTASRRERYAIARLRVAGLTEEQGRTLWTRALELVRDRPN